MLYNALSFVNGEENPKIAPYSWDFISHTGGGPRHGDRQHTQKFGKDSACGSRDMLADRQTDTHSVHTHRRTHYNILLPLPWVK